NRKRMSAIYRYPDGRIVLLCKGADSVILERLKEPSEMTPEEIQVLDKTMEHLAEFASEGLRTLLYASKELTQKEYDDWSERYNQASMALENRAELMEQVAEEIECDLCLLGATAIEDKLQVGVGDTIEKLRRADIKIWMLTGDKKETAVNIAYTCRLAKEGSEMVMITGSDEKTVSESIDVAYEKCKTAYFDRINNRNAARRNSKTLTGKRSQVGINILAKSSKDKLAEGEKDATPKDNETHCIVIVDGDTLSLLEQQHEKWSREKPSDSPSLLDKFLRIGILSDSVVCCRFSPSQKALVVTKVRDIVSQSDFTEQSVINLVGGTNETTKSFWQRLKEYIYYNEHPSGVTLAIGD
ncbi:hypothetical protein HDV05_002927, partial [Chytridiales sp. JEL 0842]